MDDEVADFVASAYSLLLDEFRFIILSPSNLEHFIARINKLGVPSEIVITKFVPHSSIPLWLSLADFAINPVKPVPSKRFCTSIKDGEYWACGLPVIIPSNISDDSLIIEENDIGYVLKDLSDHEYRYAILKIKELYTIYGKAGLKLKIRKSLAISWLPHCSFCLHINLFMTRILVTGAAGLLIL